MNDSDYGDYRRGYHNECVYTTERGCPGKRNIFVAGLACPSPFVGVDESRFGWGRCSDDVEDTVSGETVGESLADECKDSLREAIIDNEYPGLGLGLAGKLFPPLCSLGSAPVTVVQPVVVYTASYPPGDTTHYSAGCEVGCAAIVQCVEPTFSPSPPVLSPFR